MIIRQLCRRQGRSLFFATRPNQCRYLGTESDGFLSRFGSDDVSSAPLQTSGRELLQKDMPTPVEAHNMRSLRRAQFSQLGTKLEPEYEPESILRNPTAASDITLEFLLASQTHLGHSTSLWNPRNSSYIFGIREGIHIISLEVTAAYLRRAAKIVEDVARRGGLILFVGTRKGHHRAVVRAAELAKGYHVFRRWIPGSITNGQQTLGHCKLKVVDEFDNELPEYQRRLIGHPVLRPDLVVCLNPMENEPLLTECLEFNIPTIGIIDTNADVTKVTYPIPANDDSFRSVAVIAGALGRAGEAGQKKRFEEAKSGKLSYPRITPEELEQLPEEGTV